MGALTRSCTELTPKPKERIAEYASRTVKLAGAGKAGFPSLPIQVGLLFPANQAA
jgi:hypothetical protein